MKRDEMLEDRQRCVIRNEQNRCIISKLLMTPQVFLEHGRELGIVEHSFNDYVAVATTESSPKVKGRLRNGHSRRCLHAT